MELIDEKDDFPLALLDFIDHRLEPLFELATILRSGDETRHIEGANLSIEEHLWHFTSDDLTSDPLDDRSLPDSWITNEDWIILRSAGKNLDRAIDLILSTDHGIDLS
jgi:hypothetical protein